jgi:hypothetical protein
MLVLKWENWESQHEFVKKLKVLGVVMINSKHLFRVHCQAQLVCQMGRGCMVKYSMVGDD